MDVCECLCSMCPLGIAVCSLLNAMAVILGLPPQASATEQKVVVVVSVSPQSRASLAARYDLSSSEAGRRLTSFFKGLGECRCCSI